MTAQSPMQYAWTAANEAQFIDTLGKHTAHLTPPLDRRTLLAGYLAGLTRRSRGFTSAQMIALRDHARMALEELEDACTTR